MAIPFRGDYKIDEEGLGRYERDIRALRTEAPHVSLFPTFVHRLDGTLVGCATLIPELTYELMAVMQADDLTRAREINDRIWPVKEAVYDGGEPSGDAHARMKQGLALRGLFRSALVRLPVLSPSAEDVAAMAAALEASGIARVDLV
jgi:4-hydroxy-tetrahydrodipicolinate synthase